MFKLVWGVVVAVTPMFALAHTRWFAEHELTPFTTSEPTILYLAIWIGIIISMVALGTWLNRLRWCTLGFLEPKKPHVFERAASTFVMVCGAFFVIAGTHEYVFSPNITVSSGIPMALVVIEILIGLAFLLGIASRVSGIILGLVWISLFHYVGWLAALEDIWVLGIAIFATLMGNDYFSIISFSFLRSLVCPYKRYALALLRISTGLTLMVLGLSEKIFAPEYGIHFLAIYDWNFMSKLGFTYSDYLFTISAGAVEFLFGLIFLLGIMTRLNALVVAIIFSIPLFLLGPVELSGHLPHFAAVVLLLLFGSGGHFIFMKKRGQAC